MRQVRQPRVPLPLVHIDAVPFVGRWAYLLWRLRNPGETIECALPTVPPDPLPSEPPPLEASPLEQLGYTLYRVCMLAELLFARCLNVYEGLPLYLTEEGQSSTGRRYLRLPHDFRYHTWRPEKSLFGMLHEFWQTNFEAWDACQHRQWSIPHLSAEPSRQFQQQLEGWAAEQLSRWAVYFRWTPWFAWHAEQEELDESVIDHPVGRFRQLCERVFGWLADWNATPYRLTHLLPKTAELVELVGEMMELIAVRCPREMEEL
jgi:hypothetical protein